MNDNVGTLGARRGNTTNTNNTTNTKNRDGKDSGYDWRKPQLSREESIEQIIIIPPPLRAPSNEGNRLPASPSPRAQDLSQDEPAHGDRCADEAGEGEGKDKLGDKEHDWVDGMRASEEGDSAAMKAERHAQARHTRTAERSVARDVLSEHQLIPRPPHSEQPRSEVPKPLAPRRLPSIIVTRSATKLSAPSAKSDPAGHEPSTVAQGACKQSYAEFERYLESPAVIKQIKGGKRVSCIKLGSCLGGGAFGKVFGGSHSFTRDGVAVKQLRKPYSNATALCILTEIEVMAQLAHPYITHIYQVIETPTSTNLVMELGESGTLKKWVAHNQGPTRIVRATTLFFRILEGISYLHNNAHIAHRDLKAENIFMRRNDTPMIGDFGFAIDTRVYPRSALFCGSPLFCAPEILLEREYAPKQVDVWSCAILLLFIIKEGHPLHPDDAATWTQKLLDDVVHASMPTAVLKKWGNLMLKRDPDARCLPVLEEFAPPHWQCYDDAELELHVLPQLQAAVQECGLDVRPLQVSLPEDHSKAGIEEMNEASPLERQLEPPKNNGQREQCASREPRELRNGKSGVLNIIRRRTKMRAYFSNMLDEQQPQHQPQVAMIIGVDQGRRDAKPMQAPSVPAPSWAESNPGQQIAPSTAEAVVPTFTATGSVRSSEQSTAPRSAQHPTSINLATASSQVDTASSQSLQTRAEEPRSRWWWTRHQHRRRKKAASNNAHAMQSPTQSAVCNIL